MRGWIILVLLLAIPIVNGLGVAQDYLEDNTLRLLQGENHYLKLVMQNPDDTPVIVKLEVEGEIVQIVDYKENYTLAPTSYNNEVFLNITSPKNSKLGDYYKIVYSMVPIQEQTGSGQIGMKMRLRRSFDVVIVNEDGVGYNEYILKKEKELQKPGKFDSMKKTFSIIFVLVLLASVLTLIARKSSTISNKIILKKKKEISKQEDKPEETKKKTTYIEEKKKELKKAEKQKTIFVEEPAVIKESVEEKEPEQSIYKQETSSKDKYFYLSNGQVLKSVFELFRYLNKMPDEVFYHHVNEERNDFANWIQGVFQLTELADELVPCKTKEKFKNVLEKKLK